MGNTVGSTNTDFCDLKLTKEVAYIIGLWCADGYTRTSSLGFSNTNPDLIERFSRFLLELFPRRRLRKDVYYPDNNKRRTTAYHVYVNCRSLVRLFIKFKRNPLDFIRGNLVSPYFGGRFDGDGCVGKDFYSDCRIVYGKEEEARNDLDLIRSLGFQRCKIYHYKAARTFCLYISRLETKQFLALIYPYSSRLQKSVFVPRRDLISN
mgnify:CR=1 FL=1